MQFIVFINRYLRQLIKPKRLAILEAVLIGLVAAGSAVLLRQGTYWFGAWRSYAVLPLPVWLLLPLVGLVGGLVAGLLVERLAPETTGSGVPQVKAALAYFPIALNLRVAIVKLIATTITLSSGFALGRQGPTVQIGAALAAQLSRWVPASPDHQRQLIAAGAAAGLAAGFDAPIAGVLFVIEELLHDVSSLTLGTAILASFTGGVVSRTLGGPNLRLGSSTLILNFSPQEIPFFLLLGGLVGVFAALFNRSILLGAQWNRHRLRAVSLPLKMGGAGLLSGAIAAFLPVAFRDNTALQGFLTVGANDWRTTAIAFVAQFSLTVIACSVETPGGLFVPSLVLGAALGYLVGGLEDVVLGGQPITYALVGMAAFFGAVAKVPITAIVIVFEMTTTFSLILPLMIGSVTAYLVTELLAPGSLYTHLLQLKGIHLEAEDNNEALWARITAAEVMQTKVETLNSRMPLDEVLQAFAHSHHRGFPVVDAGRLVGIVTQRDLDKMTVRQLPDAALLAEIMSNQPITVPPAASLSQVLYLMSRYKLSRLPVVDQRKLVGIITRSDILRVESDKLRGGTHQLGPQPQPSYVVYQTRSPAIGQGRLLLPLSNPQTAGGLLKLALAISRERRYELECLQVVMVPRHSTPAETPVSTTLSRRLLSQATRQGHLWQVPTHTQIRTSHTVIQAILESVQERHIDLLLMGWKGDTSTPGRIFGDTVDTAIRQIACDVVLVKLGAAFIADSSITSEPPSLQALMQVMRLQHWLIPIAGGPNSQHAITLLPALTSLCPRPKITLCQVFSASETDHNPALLETNASFLRQKLAGEVSTLSVCAASPADAVIHIAQTSQCDVIVLGASREGLLKQAIQGNIPESIARNSSCTVILVRKAIA